MMAKTGAKIFESHESNVRTYCRSFPRVFVRGKNALLYDEEEKRYIDFFAGGGALNYGHNPDWIKAQCGRDDTVLKIMPSLTIEDDILEEGCQILYSVLQSGG